ncbi:MAG: right-handed parallel beta-helix repeat-containing protein [Oscillospiraceae bacterium]|nr:right-handed parallel beta-helix repeat-containing protein [Oscillospiraceae bacterium]
MRTLLILTLGGSALALVLLALRYVFLRKMPSTVYYYAWLLVLLRFVLPLPGLVPTGRQAAPIAAPVAVSAPLNREAETELPAGAYLPPAAPQAVPAASVQATEPEVAPAVEAKPPLRIIWRSPRLWLGLWALGTGACFLFPAASYLRFTRRLRGALRRPDRFTRSVYAAIPGHKPALYRCAPVKTPLSYGLIRPKIVLPDRDYDEELLTNILRHELTHYRRFDALYKWLAVAVLSTQWFNPLSYLIRRELDRSCELSCDEVLLRRMTRGEKQSYGKTLLSMAASASLPAGVVATTFATEKRDLKERLEQIMHYKKNGARLLSAVLALALLAGCAVGAGPAAAKPAETPASDAVRVTNVDELLAAIAPGAVIELAAGEYDLSTASDYGGESTNPYYSWNAVYGGEEQYSAELVIQNVEHLTLRGEGRELTTIAAMPRYANVIRFVGCKNLTITDLTAGHTREPGFCSGGVLRLESCQNTNVIACGLYGCGTVGVDALDCDGLTVFTSRIYECSNSAVSVSRCRNVRVDTCEIDSHGTRAGQGEAMMLLEADYSEGFTVHHCDIHDNAAQYLLRANYSKNALFLSNDVHDNRLSASVFLFEQYPAVVDGCRFEANSFRIWVPDHRFDPVDVNGDPLEAAELNEMSLRDIDPDVAVTPAPAAKAAEVRPGGEIAVTSVDEFLTAIGPDRTIVLDGALFDLSTATSYGSAGGEYWYWAESHDGPALVIHDANGLTIRAKDSSPEATTLSAIPRFADVLSFRNCDDLSLFGFTAGHTKEPGVCSGGVLRFENCNQVTVKSMRLYGCGILGVQASRCTSMEILRTEIYECSQGAAQFYQTDGIIFDSCFVRDVPSPALVFTECGDKSWNSVPLSGLNGMYDVDENGVIPYETILRKEGADYLGTLDELLNPYADEPTHHYQAGYPQAEFVYAVRQAIADGDWETLADKLNYPLNVFTEGYGFHLWTREEFMNSVGNENFMHNTFNEDYRQRIADSSIVEIGNCVFGETFCDHMLAFSCFGDEVTEDTLKVTAISFAGPLWPGRSEAAYVQAVPPTPMP